MSSDVYGRMVLIGVGGFLNGGRRNGGADKVVGNKKYLYQRIESSPNRPNMYKNMPLLKISNAF